MEKENEAGLNPPNKKRRLSLSRKKPLREVNTSRFASPTKPDEFKKAAEGVVPNNTRQNTKWAVSTFLSWVEECNKRVPEQIDCDVLSCNDAECLSYVLRLFLIEAKKMAGEKYPPGTIRNLLSRINRELVKNKAEFSIMDRSDRRFRELHLTLDSITSELHRTGVGVNRKNAEVISKDLEDLCWEKGSLGMPSPMVLQHTVFFYIFYMFNQGVPEKVIADKSGHRSLDGLRAYEHPSRNLEKAAGEVIADPTRSFEDIKQQKELAVEEVKQKPIDILQQLPGFSGLNNCTINFNFTYGK